MARRRNSSTTNAQVFETEAEADAAVEAFHALAPAEQVSAWPPLQKRLAAFLKSTWAIKPRDPMKTAETLYRLPGSHRKTMIFRPGPPPAGYVPGQSEN